MTFRPLDTHVPLSAFNYVHLALMGRSLIQSFYQIDNPPPPLAPTIKSVCVYFVFIIGLWRFVRPPFWLKYVLIPNSVCLSFRKLYK